VSFALGSIAKFTGPARVRTCGRKVKHWNIRTAQNHLNGIIIRFGLEKNSNLRAYRCADCGAWHVGRVTRTEKERETA